MDKKYVGTSMDRRYRGEAGDITYNVRRCIHAKHCVDRLAQVFDRDKRPWINADGAPADAISEIVGMCPSGALHFERKDGVTESVPAENVIRLWLNGPLEFHGDLDIEGSTVSIQNETRVTLCRCGASKNKPFCDNSHREVDFQAEDTGTKIAAPTQSRDGKLSIMVEMNGPLRVAGNIEIVNADGQVIFSGGDVSLCRCGHSSNKPFCDGTHNKIAFEGE
jgi:CDGSH-type Zn-finger protein/uncharacterized Fe-S cluster protein YjdI